MTNPISYPNQRIPANYSGVTINITNPTVNTAPQDGCYQPQQAGIYTMPQGNYYPPVQNEIYPAPQNNYYPQPQIQTGQISDVSTPETSSAQKEIQQTNTNNTVEHIRESQYVQNPIDNKELKPENNAVNAYPPQYYLNNYNYIQGAAQKNNKTPENTQTAELNKNDLPADELNSVQIQDEENLETSKEIINELDARNAEQKELEKNGKKTRVVALTNEYIMSLENYLNNPNTELRLMASKEILTRLDEDKNRYDDAALNALLNKMLQDPEKLVRIAALSAFSSGLASGNDYTETLLKQIQQAPNADKEDVLEASEILLKRSASTEIRYTQATEPKAETKEGDK